MSTITWLHLSDLHFQVGEPATWDRDIVLKKLLEDIRQRIADDGLRPDLIFVSGDLAFAGQRREYKLAGQFFDELLAATGLGKDRLLLVPGNHDVDRKAVTGGAKVIATGLENRQALNAVLTMAPDRRLLLSRLKEYGRFVKEYFAGQQVFDDEHYFHTRSFDVAGQRVAVLGLNTAWLAAGDEDRGKLALGERQVRQALEATREAKLRIAFMHHPVDWLREFDQEDCQPLLMDGCAFLLHGHLHRAGLLDLKNPDGRTMILAAGACYESRQHPNGYNWVQLDPVAGQGTVHFRTYSDKQGGFWTKDATTYKNVPNGEFSFALPVAVAPRAPKPARPPTTSPAETARWRKKYLEKMFETCGALPLATLGGEEGADKDVTLEDVYIQLATTTHVPVSEQEQQARRAARSGIEPDATSRPLTALEAAQQSTRLVLLGEPGAGKSFFVRRLLTWLASSHLSGVACPAGLGGELLPVLVLLRDLTPRLAGLGLEAMPEERQQQELAAVVRDEILDRLADFEAAGFAAGMSEALEAGQCLLVLDGLDEVPPELRTRVRQAALAVSRKHRLARVILTCRVRSYVGDAVLPGFQTHTLAPFDRDQITQFAGAWYRAQEKLGRVTAEQAKAKAGNLAEAALSPDLRELSANPMMLTTMAIIHQKEVGLPKERVRLYDLAVEVLLLRWQKRKAGAAGLAPSPRLSAFLRQDLPLRRVMERLAYESHRAGQGDRKAAELERGTALTILESPKCLGEVGLAAEFLDYVDQRAGLLLGRGGEPGRPVTYGFPHRTFQEYLAGGHLVGQREPAREYFTRAGEGDYWTLAALLGAEELYYNRRNQNGLLDLAYRLCPAQPPADDRERRVLLWSARMAALVGAEEIRRDTDSPDGGRAYLDRLIPRLIELMRSDWIALERAEAGRALGKLGDPRRGVGLTANGLPDIDWIELPPGPFPMGNNKPEAKWDDESPRFTCNLIRQAYGLSRYPITVAQFQAFIAAGGYQTKQYWTEAGWAWRQENEVTGPQHYDEVFQTANHPRVGVSWYEAIAFCRWLSDCSGRTVTLPNEAQWERAARHTDGRIYPWGNAEEAPRRCNIDATGIRSTSAVGMFPSGNASCGAADMAGNVIEWCRTKWRHNYQAYEENADDDLEGDKARVFRGGSCGLNADLARCAARSRFDPVFRGRDIGFRVVVSPFPSGL